MASTAYFLMPLSQTYIQFLCLVICLSTVDMEFCIEYLQKLIKRSEVPNKNIHLFHTNYKLEENHIDSDPLLNLSYIQFL